MSRDNEDRFRPPPGRIRSDARGGAATKSFFTRVRKIARLAHPRIETQWRVGRPSARQGRRRP
jgi:hypothetical protein